MTLAETVFFEKKWWNVKKEYRPTTDSLFILIETKNDIRVIRAEELDTDINPAYRKEPK